MFAMAPDKADRGGERQFPLFVFGVKTFLIAGWVIGLMHLAMYPAHATTLIVDGQLRGVVEFRQQVTFGIEKRISELTYRFPMPANLDLPNIKQRVELPQVTYSVEPITVNDETDAYGNRFKVATWRSLDRDVQVEIGYTAAIDTDLRTLEAEAPFPVKAVPRDAALYLTPTKLVQSDDEEIVALAAQLTGKAKNQAAAVDAIFNYVTDHIRYESPPKAYDALTGLRAGAGNCQNYSHLAAALMRAAGIPARVAVGITLKDKWKIPSGKGASVLHSMAEGLHSWVEVWFPDLGWLACDPQQSKQFTSTRHIKYAHGPECADLGPYWLSTPVHPRYESIISARFLKDRIDLRLKGTGNEPRGYLASNELVAAAPLPPVDTTTLPVTKPVPAPEPLPLVAHAEPTPAPVPLPAPPPLPVVAPPKPEPPDPQPVRKADSSPRPTLPVPQPSPVPSPPQPVKKPEASVEPPPAAKPAPPPAPSAPTTPPTTAKPVPPPEPPRLSTQPGPPPPQPPVKPPPPATTPPSPPVPADAGKPFEVGNIRLPAPIKFFNISGERGEVALEQETAEYITSQYLFAQAFRLDRPLNLKAVALAMHKFGGDGTVYVDVVSDEGDRPGLAGLRSLPLPVESIKRTHGYDWVDFTFPDGNAPLAPGKHWIVLRHSGEAIMTWYYTPGKHYGDPDDTRSTAKGWEWEDILTYDFVFRLQGSPAEAVTKQ